MEFQFLEILKEQVRQILVHNGLDQASATYGSQSLWIRLVDMRLWKHLVAGGFLWVLSPCCLGIEYLWVFSPCFEGDRQQSPSTLPPACIWPRAILASSWKRLPTPGLDRNDPNLNREVRLDDFLRFNPDLFFYDYISSMYCNWQVFNKSVVLRQNPSALLCQNSFCL